MSGNQFSVERNTNCALLRLLQDWWRINTAVQSVNGQALRPGREPGSHRCHNTAAFALTCTHTVSHNPIFGIGLSHRTSTTLNELMHEWTKTPNMSLPRPSDCFWLQKGVSLIRPTRRNTNTSTQTQERMRARWCCHVLVCQPVLHIQRNVTE